MMNEVLVEKVKTEVHVVTIGEDEWEEGALTGEVSVHQGVDRFSSVRLIKFS
jgi:hypothetical protein